MSPTRLLLLALLVLTVGCNLVSGKVDGESITIRTAFMVEYDDVFPNGDEVISVILLGSSLNCQDLSQWEEAQIALRNAEVWDDYADNWADHMPEDFWSVFIAIRVEDLDDQINQAVEGGYWRDPLSDHDEAIADVTHFTEHPDEDQLSGLDSDDWQELFRSDGGELVVNAHRPGESIAGSFSTTMVDYEDGDDEGDVTIRFNASHCQALEDVYD